VTALSAAESKYKEAVYARQRAEQADIRVAGESTAKQARAAQLLAGRAERETAALDNLIQKRLAARQADGAVTAELKRRGPPANKPKMISAKRKTKSVRLSVFES